MSQIDSIIHCAGISLINNGKIFLVKARAISKFWGIPKGHIEQGESPEDCAKREFLEETGIEVFGDIDFFINLETFVKESKKLVKVYKCVGDGKEKFDITQVMKLEDGVTPENVEGGWFDYIECEDMIIPYQVPLIRKLRAEDKLFKPFLKNRTQNIITV